MDTIAICVLVFIWQQSLPPQAERLAYYSPGFVPANASGAALLPSEIVVVPAWATVVTAMFLHGGWMHVMEHALPLDFRRQCRGTHGTGQIPGLLHSVRWSGSLYQFAIDPASRVPMVGASGGIAGILGAYLVLHPRAAIRTFILIIIFVRFINLPAWLVLGIWIGGQFLAVPSALEEPMAASPISPILAAS